MWIGFSFPLSVSRWPNLNFPAMASGAVLQRLQQRAAQADQLIAQLRAQLDLLKRSAATTSCRAEEDKLASENDVLKQEVKQMRQKLINLEVNNGIRQIRIPARTYQPAAAVVAAAAPAAGTGAAAGEEKKPQQTDQKQQKKPKKEGKEKPKAAVSDRPVDVSCLDMRIGLIVKAEKHPDADTLYVEEVDLGEERNRTIVSGLVKHVSLEQMQQRVAIFMCNLKPVKMRGILSEGMIMCASTPELVEILVPPHDVRIGDVVTVEGYPGTPPEMLPPKKKMWEQVQPDLRVNEEGLATYKGARWVVGTKGNVKAPSMKNVGIR